MKNYFKYYGEDEVTPKWGIEIITVGGLKFSPGEHYPGLNHPSDHNFFWNKGRVLNGYYVVFISKGSGIFEADNSSPRSVKAGTAFLLFPGIWHRYRPEKMVGWEEYWIGFRGAYPDMLMKSGLFSVDSPVISVGFNEQLVDLYQRLVSISQAGVINSQPFMVGQLFQILGIVQAAYSQQISNRSPQETLLEKARFLLHERVDQLVDMAALAKEMGVGYVWFRKAFKERMKMSPNQYLIQLKINKAKELLRTTYLSVNEVAYLVGFSSPFYFSRLFKQKTSLSPQQYRIQSQGLCNEL